MNAQDIKTVTLVINSDQAKKKLDAINVQLDEARRKREEAFNKGDASGITVYTREMRRLEREAERMQSRAQTVAKVLRNLDSATPNELGKTIREINKELNSGNVARGSEEWKILTRAMGDARRELNRIQEENRAAAATMQDNAAFFGSRWVGLTSVLTQAKDAFASFMDGAMDFVNDYADLAEHMSGVKKYTGLDEEAVRDLNEAFKQMDTRTAREQLNDLAGDAGRLGIQGKQDILDFVEAADQINVALGEDLGDDAVKNIGKLAQLFGDADTMGLKQAMLSTGSVINELAQSSSASEGYIMDFTARLAGVGRQAGMTQAQVMAFASVLDQGMVGVEKSATALQNVITALYRKPAEMAKVAGLDVKAFTDLLQTDGNAAVMQFITSLNQAGTMDKLAPMLDEMKLSGAGVTQTLSTLAANIDSLKDTQDQATEAFRDGTSITTEFNTANSTAQAELEKARKKLYDLRVELGERLEPVITQVLSVGGRAISILSTLITFAATHTRTIAVLTTTVVAYTVAVNASIIADKLKVFWTNTVMASLRKLYAVLMANPYAALIAVVALFVGWLQDEAEAAAEARRQQDLLNDVRAEGTKAAAREQGQMEKLLAIARDETKSKAERLEAIRKLNQISPEYLGNLNLETINTDAAAAAVRRYVAALRLKKQIESAQDKLDSLEDERKAAPEKARGGFWQQVSDGFKKMVNDFDSMMGQPILSGSWSQNKESTAQGRYDNIIANINERRNRLQKAIDEWTEQLVNLDSEVATAVKPQGGGGGGGGGKPGKDKKEDHTKQASERLKNQAEADRLVTRLQYEAGITDHREYADTLLQIDEQLYTDQRDLYQKGTPEWVQMEQKRLDAVAASRKQYNAWSIADIDRQEQEENGNIRDNYLHGILSEEQYQRALTNTRLKYLKQRADMSRDWGQEDDADNYQRQYDETIQAEQLQRQKDFLQKVDAFKKDYLQKSQAEQMTDELAFADNLRARGLLSEEEYQKAKAEIAEKYTEKAEATDLGRPADAMSQGVLSTIDALQKLHENLKNGEATWQDYAAVGMAAMQSVMAMMQSASQLMQANAQLEEARVTKRYDAEIEKAGANTKKGKKLEEQKQKELAKIKTKYNKKQMAIEIAQAVATTAMNAIKAYGAMANIPVVGPVLGIAAAAAATAAGMIQIAAIKKQHAAEAAGYYEGGFTGGNRYRRTAGVVHEGEFVANHEAVNNPNVLPVLRLIDHAQRTNRIASLTAADVSRAVAAPMATATNTAMPSAAPAVQVVDTASRDTADTLARLNERLDEGIRATVVIDGPDGLARQWKRYNKMNQI